MKILVTGSGGREHAMCWRLSRSPSASQVYCAPGNPGTARCATNVAIDAGDIRTLLSFAAEEGIGLTVVGPEAPLCEGIHDRFAERGLLVAGPTMAAARLEGSKAFAKQFMERNAIATAPFGVFEQAAAAGEYIDAHPDALVVKADGLAAGKGVIVCSDPAHAKREAKRLLDGGMGAAGKRVVVERKLVGEEASFIVMTDGERICELPTSQDHKAAYDGDRGPNTGGMGAYSPAPVLSADLRRRAMKEIVEPSILGMAAEGNPYRGFLYVGVMVSATGDLDVLEYNCRLGDPETQPLMCRMDDDLVPFLDGLARGALPPRRVIVDPRAALCVVMAAAGYPGACEVGTPIEGLERAATMEDVVVFHAGTATGGAGTITAGGRVLGVTAMGDTIQAARDRAYGAVDEIRWEGVQHRTDIGARALER